MPSRFFERQQAARRLSVWLFFMFVAGLLSCLVAMDAFFYFFALVSGQLEAGDHVLWHAWTLQAIVGTLIIIGGGSLFEWYQLKRGGAAVAEMMGAQRVSFDSKDVAIKRYVNVVQEMAIASGTTLPELYTMPHQRGINAFVAGYSERDAAMVVSQGCLDVLTREELQGVVGHEFSHILNGDMRFNIRLLAVLAGLVAMGEIGQFLLSSNGSLKQRDREHHGSAIIIAVGAAMWLVGSMGLLWGRLIRAAISRQREYLADAASVQFTRNPQGIAGALYKIVIQEEHSYLHGAHAESLGHMAFSETLSLSSLFATHPPLDKRIAQIDSSFVVRARARQHKASLENQADQAVSSFASGSIESFVPKQVEDKPALEFRSSLSELTHNASSSKAAKSVPVHQVAGTTAIKASESAFTADKPAIEFHSVLVAAEEVVESVETVRAFDMVQAQQLLKSLPIEVTKALESTAGSQALLLAIMAEHSVLGDRAIAQQLRDADLTHLVESIYTLRRDLAAFEKDISLPLVELLLPRLSVLDAGAIKKLFNVINELAQADGKISIFEFCLMILVHQLVEPIPTHYGRFTIKQLVNSCATILGRLLQIDSNEDINEPLNKIFAEINIERISHVDLSDAALRKSLLDVRKLNPEMKRQLLTACVMAVKYDNQFTLQEYELLRAIAAVLSCPMPLVMMDS